MSAGERGRNPIRRVLFPCLDCGGRIRPILQGRWAASTAHYGQNRPRGRTTHLHRQCTLRSGSGSRSKGGFDRYAAVPSQSVPCTCLLVGTGVTFPVCSTPCFTCSGQAANGATCQVIFRPGPLWRTSSCRPRSDTMLADRKREFWPHPAELTERNFQQARRLCRRNVHRLDQLRQRQD
jgi:hypothetical protein